MEQASSKHGPVLDDEMKAETTGLVQSNHDTRAEESRSPQPSGEDQPDVDRAPDTTLTGGPPDGMTAADVEGRSELASYLDRSTFPADRAQLRRDAGDNNAPDHVLREIDRLPEGRQFTNVQEVWSALGGGTEAHRF